MKSKPMDFTAPVTASFWSAMRKIIMLVFAAFMAAIVVSAIDSTLAVVSGEAPRWLLTGY